MLSRDNLYDIHAFMRDNDITDIIKIDIGVRIFIGYKPGRFEPYYIYKYMPSGTVYTLGRYFGLGDTHDAFNDFVRKEREP